MERSILALEATNLGLVVSKSEIEQAVLDSSGFRDSNGRFDREGFERYVSYEYGSERNFVIDQRINMLAGKMARLVEENARVSEASQTRQRGSSLAAAFTSSAPRAADHARRDRRRSPRGRWDS